MSELMRAFTSQTHQRTRLTPIGFSYKLNYLRKYITDTAYVSPYATYETRKSLNGAYMKAYSHWQIMKAHPVQVPRYQLGTSREILTRYRCFCHYRVSMVRCNT
jgi:hypothetical protein